MIRGVMLGSVVLMLAALAPAVPVHDVLLVGGRVVDGTGMPWFHADVAIRDGRVSAIGKLASASARIVIDVGGLVVAPGFIDVHTHLAGALEKGDALENFLRDGVTSVIDGNDGRSGWPIAAALTRLQQARPSLNVGTFVGFAEIRRAVMSGRSTPATAQEVAQMRAHIASAMREGAFGVSSGLEPCLYHQPGYFASKDELSAVLSELARTGGIHSSHIRDEAAGLASAVAEVIAISEATRVPVQITHWKTVGASNRGKGAKLMALIQNARDRGIDVTLDQFPYNDNGIALTQLLPPATFSEGRAHLEASIADPALHAGLRKYVAAKIVEHAGSAKNLFFRGCQKATDAAGKSLAEVAAASGRAGQSADPAEVYLDKLAHDDCVIDEQVIDDVDIETALRAPFTMIASDGGIGPHPKSYGTRARVLGRYVRDRKILTLEEAVRRMTGLPAHRLGLWDRGLLRPGNMADIVAFDPSKVIDRATRANPAEMPEGIVHLFISGQAVLRDGRMTAARPGQILRGAAYHP